MNRTGLASVLRWLVLFAGASAPLSCSTDAEGPAPAGTAIAGAASVATAGASGSGSAPQSAGAAAAAGAAGASTNAGAAGSARPVAGSPAAAGGAGASASAPPDAGAGEPPAGGASSPPDAAAPPEAPVVCPTTPLAPGRHDGSVQFGGHDRTYLLHVPRGYTGDTAVPLIFDFHGYGQPVTSQQAASGFADLAEEHGFVVAYPAGVGGSWHVNGCCGQAAQEELDEIGSVREVLKAISAEVCVDPKRIYASGISQGGGMAHHVGCLAADIFAAVAPVSSDLRTDPCMPSRPISEISFRGTADELSAYEGGPVGPAGMQYQSIGAKPTLEKWRMINGCSEAEETTMELCQTYKQCEGGVEVSLCSIPGGGHALYNNPEGFDLAAAAWDMFTRHTLP